ncbi:MAG: fibronectin type III domain-containing protein [Candidatus Micrarchaeia archaeon]
MQNKSILLVFLGIVLLSFVLLAGCPGGGPESTGITAKAVAGGIEVSWNPSQKADVTGYNLYRSTTSGELGTKINAVLLTTTSYTDDDLQDGVTYYYTVRSVTSGGTEDASTEQASATSEISPPSGLQIQINDGSQYVNSRDVTLTLSATGASECRVSNEKQTWSSWAPYATSMSWELSEGNGHKDVYYECRDSTGNTAIPVSASTYLDTEGPSISLASPAQGKTYGTQFTLKFTVSDPISPTVTCTGEVDGSSIAIGVIDTGKEDSMKVNAEEGEHTLKLQCDDGVNTAEESVSFSVADTPDVELHIESGSGYVDTTHVTLDVIADNAAECRYSNENNGWSSWRPHVEEVEWTLSSGDGKKTVYAECKSESGQVSPTVSDSVHLDTHKGPRISIEIDNGDDWTNSRDAKLGLYCYAADQCRYRNEGGDWSGWSSYKTKKYWTLSSGEGDKKVYYNCKDSSGSDLGTAHAEITYSRKEPNPPSEMRIRINGGDSYTGSRDVSLSLRAHNADACRLKNRDGSWSSYHSYTTHMDWTLSSGSGKKTVYYQCKNDYGKESDHASIYLDTSPPGPVRGLSAYVDRNNVVHLSWSRPKGNIHDYEIYRSNTDLGLFDKIGSTRHTTYQDDGVSPGNYAYEVKAVDKAGHEGEASNTATITVPDDTRPGGDEDSHGCKESAGYSWCESLQKCIRSWDTECPEE